MTTADHEHPGSRPRGHEPRMHEQQAQRIRRWHERAYQELASVRNERTFSYLGRTLVVPPQVMPIVPVSHLLGEAVLAEVSSDDRVLDMGTGCGVNAVLAASAAREVVAADINQRALDAAAGNAARNGVADRVELRRSDVFGEVGGTFDLIIFDPPFRWFTARDTAETEITDENYTSLTAFFRQARRYLSERGRMLVFFASSGDLNYLMELADQEGFSTETIARDSLAGDDWQVEYFTFRLMPVPRRPG